MLELQGFGRRVNHLGRGRAFLWGTLIIVAAQGAMSDTARGMTLRESQPLRPQSNSSEVLDLNTCSVAELAALPGMGRVYAQRVVEGRPYSAKNQVVTRGVVPREAYEKMKERIAAHRSR